MITRSVLLWPTPILAGLALALISVLVGNQVGGYGFPLAWRTGGCPPPGIELSRSCLVAIGFDWLSFGLDLLFYTIIGSGVLFVYAKYASRTEASRRAC
jgi:hypothetical protein